MISAWGNLEDEPEVLLLTSAKVRAMQGTSQVLHRRPEGRV